MTPTDSRPGEPARRVAKSRDVALQPVPVVEDDVRPREHALALLRKAVKALSALDNRHAEFLFELPNTPRQRWLGDVTGLRRPGEVPFTRQRGHVLQLPDVHW